MTGRLAAATAVLLVLTTQAPTRLIAAGTFPVTNTNDSGPGSLRQAFSDASLAGGTIDVPAGLGTITLSTGAITFQANGPVSLLGHGVTIDGGGSTTGVIRQTGGPGTVSIDGIVVTNSNSSGALADSAPVVAFGSGRWSLTNCAITGNHSSSTLNTSVAGGLVFDDISDLTISNCWIGNNTASDPVQSSIAGGVNAQGGNVTITSSSITGNMATGGPSTVAAGGLVSEGGLLRMVNSTVSYNTATAGSGSDVAGGIDNEGSPATLVYVTLDHNSGAVGSFTAANLLDFVTGSRLFATAISNPVVGVNCNKPFISNGFNLEDDAAASCGFSPATNDIVGQDPRLGPLANNGGPAPTELPFVGSPLVDAIPPASCQAGVAAGVTTDERGVTRPQGAGCDIGAVEGSGGRPTTTTVTSSSDPSTYGQTVTFTAQVSSSAGTPTGQVTFFDGAASIGAAALVSGTAAISTGTLNAGSRSITASYGGDSAFATSVSTPLVQTVGQAGTTITLASSLNPAALGQPVSLTATVNPQFTGVPTGNITFLDGGSILAVVSASGGSANLTLSSLAAGAHSLTATYGGDTNFLGSGSPAVNQVIGDAADLAVAIGSSPASPNIGSNVTLTIDLRNNGPNDVTMAAVQLALSSTLTFVSASSPAFDPATRVWTVGPLVNGATSELQVIATITSFAGRATASIVSASLPDPNLANNTATVQIQPSGVINVNASCTLRAAIVAANTHAPFGGCPAGVPGLNIIVLPANSFQLYGDIYETLPDPNGGDALPAVTSPILIEGQGSVVGRTAIPGVPNMRVFYVKKGGSLTLHDVTVRDGLVGGPGAGVLLEGQGASIVIDSSRIVGNSSSSVGGGISSGFVNSSDHGDITIRNSSLVAQNSAQTGGGVYAAGGLTIDNSIIGEGMFNGVHYSGNSVTVNGGGLYIVAGAATISNSLIARNLATSPRGAGGGLATAVFPTTTIINSTFYRNVATYGGGIAHGGVLTVTSSVFDGNAATGDPGIGGGLVTARGGTSHIIGTTFTRNFALSGGALRNSWVSTLTDSFVLENFALNGGGIENTGVMSITRGTVSGNNDPSQVIQTGGYGGGILNLLVNDVGATAQLVMEGTTLQTNTSQGSGGGLATFGPATLTNVTIGGTNDVIGGPPDALGNVAAKAGGGILVSSGGLPGESGIAATPSLTMTGGSIAHNASLGRYSTDGGGGGLANGSSAAGGTVTLTNVSITANQSLAGGGDGGGVFNRGPFTMTGGELTNNSALSGGGLANGTNGPSGGVQVTLTGVTVSGNTAAIYGGGIENDSGQMTLANVRVSSNTSLAGGGIAVLGTEAASIVSVSAGSIIEGNTASGNMGDGGGGIYVNKGSSPVSLNVSDAIIRNNDSGNADGGGLLVKGARATITRTTISGNSAFAAGAIEVKGGVGVGSLLTLISSTVAQNGGLTVPIYIDPLSRADITDSTISGNFGSDTITSDGATTIASSTIVDNSFLNNTGALRASYPGSSLTLTNTIVLGNHEDGGFFVDCDAPGGFTTYIMSGGYNLFGQATGCPMTATDQAVDPSTLFSAVLAPLADNGGPTQTHALLPGSPAIDAGAPTCPATDQRGFPRPDPDGNPRCDIGAFEFQAPISPPVCATDVSGEVTVTRSGYLFNPGTGRFSQTVSVTNTGATPIAGPVTLTLDTLSSAATLFNATGNTNCVAPPGDPTIDVAADALGAGSSATVVLQFTDPTNAAITYVPRVLAGSAPR